MAKIGDVMKILLIGEYSNLHWTLAQGLISLGHQVTVASDGDGFKNYPRNIDFALKHQNLFGKLECLVSILENRHRLKGFDVVQIINPCFTRIHPINLYLYRFLKKNNASIFLGAFGDDYFYTKMCVENKHLRYSEFYVGDTPTCLRSNEDMKNAWLETTRGRANIEMAQTCDGIIACLYEYYVAYKDEFANKLKYIPLPINTTEIDYIKQGIPEKINFFIGINKDRSETKGSAILYSILQELHLNYKEQTNIIKAESLPYAEYLKLMKQANVVVDQLYGYSPAMNGLLSLASGKLLVGGAENEMYEMLCEKTNHPIIGITPNQEYIYSQLEKIILTKSRIPDLSENGRFFVEKHHNHLKVAQEYLRTWEA